MKESNHESDCRETRHDMAALLTRIEELEAEHAQLKSKVYGRRLFRTRSWAWLRITVAVLLALGLLGAQSKQDALYIDGNGNVGIGSTSPAQKLDVAGTIRSSNGGFQFPDNSMQITAAIIPSGAVISFNLDVCPAGWSEYTPAYGLFIRGIDKSGAKIDPDGPRSRASLQGDAVRNITGTLYGVNGGYGKAWPWGFRAGSNGAFVVKKGEPPYNPYGGGEYRPEGGSGPAAEFDASQAPNVVTASENRPKNIALLYCQKN